MFEYENAVADWRNRMMAAGGCAQADIAELEDHLREQTQRLGGGGLTPEEAFLVAARRLGDTATLTQEFRKVNAGPIFVRRLFWMIAGILVYLLIAAASSTVSQACVTLAGIVGLRGGVLATLAIITRVLFPMIGIAALCILSRPRTSDPGVGALLSSSTGKIVLVVLVTVGSLVLTVAQVFLPAVMARIMSVQEFGKIMLTLSYGRFMWPILIPVALTVALVSLRIPGRRDLPCGG